MKINDRNVNKTNKITIYSWKAHKISSSVNYKT